MAETALAIRSMKPEEIEYVWKLSTDSGWNPDMDDSKLLYSIDPDGFLIGEVDGQPVGCISALSCGEQFGLLGLHLVEQTHRGKGYGQQLWDNALKRLQGRTVAIDATLQAQDIYQQSGFHVAHQTICFKCPGGLVLRDKHEDGIAPLEELPFDEIEAYDRKYFPGSRGDFLKAWMSMPKVQGYGIRLGDHLCGYGMIRACKEGWKIGPLFADNGGAAERLYKKLSNVAGADDWVYMDVPEGSKDAVLLAARFNMQEVFRTARMYLGEIPEMNFTGVFAITSFARG